MADRDWKVYRLENWLRNFVRDIHDNQDSNFLERASNLLDILEAPVDGIQQEGNESYKVISVIDPWKRGNI